MQRWQLLMDTWSPTAPQSERAHLEQNTRKNKKDGLECTEIPVHTLNAHMYTHNTVKMALSTVNISSYKISQMRVYVCSYSSVCQQPSL